MLRSLPAQQHRRALLLLLVAGSLTGCLALNVGSPEETAKAVVAHALDAAAAACTAPASEMARVSLIFGTTYADGKLISDADWARFLNDDVTPRFPDGLTQFDVYGQWQRPDGGIAKLPSRMLLIWYVRNADSDARIDAIRSIFKQRFDQLSVMRVDGRDCVSF